MPRPIKCYCCNDFDFENCKICFQLTVEKIKSQNNPIKKEDNKREWIKKLKKSQE